MLDRWGAEVAGSPASVAAWDEAWGRFMAFSGDPVAALTTTSDDESFALGPVFVGLYLTLAGTPLDAPALASALSRARRRAAAARERSHLAALELLVAGDLTAAGDAWAGVALDLHDFAALRFAHDVFLHVGDHDRRLAATGRAVVEWEGTEGWHHVAGQHAFALNEVGRHADAERFGRSALDAVPTDAWARHALAHVYEDTADTGATIGLLHDTVDIWAEQDQIANHLWWHLALRLLDTGRHDEALAIHDRRVPEAESPFRLCDQTSLLWRAELAGVDVGDRWDVLADRWDAVVERHTYAFLDLHAILAFLRCPGHPGATRWRDGLLARRSGANERDRIFETVLVPLVGALDARTADDLDGGASVVDRLGPDLARIGGSNAQRAIVPLTFAGPPTRRTEDPT